MLKYLGKLAHATLSVVLSRKLFMAVTAIWMMYGVYWGAVRQLYTFEKPEQIVAFEKFTSQMMWGTATVALWYIGVQGVSNFSNASSVASIMQSATSAVYEKIDQKNTTVNIDIIKKYEEEYAADPSYRPILPEESNMEVWR